MGSGAITPFRSDRWLFTIVVLFTCAIRYNTGDATATTNPTVDTTTTGALTFTSTADATTANPKTADTTTGGYQTRKPCLLQYHYLARKTWSAEENNSYYYSSGQKFELMCGPDFANQGGNWWQCDNGEWIETANCVAKTDAIYIILVLLFAVAALLFIACTYLMITGLFGPKPRVSAQGDKPSTMKGAISVNLASVEYGAADETKLTFQTLLLTSDGQVGNPETPATTKEEVIQMPAIEDAIGSVSETDSGSVLKETKEDDYCQTPFDKPLPKIGFGPPVIQETKEKKKKRKRKKKSKITAAEEVKTKKIKKKPASQGGKTKKIKKKPASQAQETLQTSKYEGGWSGLPTLLL